MGSSLYFAANDGTNGVELWSYNGTSASMVANINGGGSSNPYSLMAAGSTLFFVADDGSHGYELWKVSGTSASMIRDLYAGSSGSNPGGSYGTAMATDGTSLYFRATTLNGYELFQTDGTTTSLVKTIGADGYLPENFALAAGDLYFSADVGGHGNELWKLTLNADRTDLFYTAAWQVIEEREDGEENATVQNMWSPVYVNALILRDSDTTGGGNLGKSGSGLDERVYVQHDANFNVTAITNISGTVVERYLYDPYGNHIVTSDVYEPLLNNASVFFMDTLYQGGKYNAATGLYVFQRREYSPTLMRWIEQEPSGSTYIDGMGLYETLRSNPINSVDPTGRVTIFIHGVESNSEVYSTFITEAYKVWPKTSVWDKKQELIPFNWEYATGTKWWFINSRNSFFNASDSIGSRQNAGSTIMSFGMSKQQWSAVQKLRFLVQDLRELFDKEPCLKYEKINIIAHSQGTLITLAALQSGVKVDGVMFMGSPLDKEIVEEKELNTDLSVANKNTTFLMNLYSPGDWTVGYKGGIGRNGIPSNILSDQIVQTEMEGVGHGDWWKGAWLEAFSKTPNGETGMPWFLYTDSEYSATALAEIAKLRKEAEAPLSR
jgi:RHS repeat-associated protein